MLAAHIYLGAFVRLERRLLWEKCDRRKRGCEVLGSELGYQLGPDAKHVWLSSKCQTSKHWVTNWVLLGAPRIQHELC